jgi:hypothetical protein
MNIQSFIFILFLGFFKFDYNFFIHFDRDFAHCAIGVLDLSFSQSDIRVYDVLNRKNTDLNDLTAIELAYNSDNKVISISIIDI